MQECTTEIDTHWMNIALEAAAEAAKQDEVPVGAVAVSASGECLGVFHNVRESEQDPTAHAELLAMRAAAQRLGSWRLEGVTIYVTLEPCPMCAGALVNSRVARLVYGCRDSKAGAVDSLYNICRDVRLNHRLSVTSGVCEEACRTVLRSFFETLRATRREEKARSVGRGGREVEGA